MCFYRYMRNVMIPFFVSFFTLGFFFHFLLYLFLSRVHSKQTLFWMKEIQQPNFLHRLLHFMCWWQCFYNRKKVDKVLRLKLNRQTMITFEQVLHIVDSSKSERTLGIFLAREREIIKQHVHVHFPLYSLTYFYKQRFNLSNA